MVIAKVWNLDVLNIWMAELSLGHDMEAYFRGDCKSKNRNCAIAFDLI